MTRTLTIFLAALALGGCAATDSGEAMIRGYDPLKITAPPSDPLSRAAGTDVEAVTVPVDAGVETYVQLALERNPRIAAARWRIEALQEQIPQMTSLADPMLDASFIGETNRDAMLGVSQAFPFPGKLSTAGDIARREVAMGEQELRQTELEIAADVRRAYWSYYTTDRAIGINTEARELLSQFQEIANARLRTGAVTQEDALRAATELSTLDTDLIDLRQQRLTAIAMLNSLLDRAIDAPLPDPQPAPTVEQMHLALRPLLHTAAAVNPQLEQVRQRIAAEDLRYDLARLNRWPDFSVGLTYEFMDEGGMGDGEDEWWITFGLNVPLWQNTRRAAERQALANRQAAIADLQTTLNALAFRIQQALNDLQAQERQVVLLRDVVLPQARQTVDASASAYRAGRTNFESLVSNWRQLLETRLMYERSLAGLGTALAELEQAVGTDVTSLSPDAGAINVVPDTNGSQNP